MPSVQLYQIHSSLPQCGNFVKSLKLLELLQDSILFTLKLDALTVYMTHSQMLGKFEYTGGPIFKVVLEC